MDATPGRDIVSRIRAGDDAAYEALYVDTFPALWSFARRYVSDAVAEEIVQDVFLRLWERRATWEVRSSVRAYLFGAVRNRAFHATEHDAVVQRVAAEQRAASGATAPTARDAAASDDETNELLDAVMQAIEGLPERQRAAMILRVQRDLSHAEIGEALGVTAAAAGVLVRKGEAKLRLALAKHLPGE